MSNVLKQLDSLTTADELLIYIQSTFPTKQYLFKQVTELIGLFEDEENSKISINSLKTMLLFYILLMSLANQ